MKRQIRYALLLSTLLAGACAHNPPPPPMADAAPPPPHPMLSQADQNFIQTAATSDAFEEQTSQLATQKAHGKSVKDFAAKMEQDHGATTQQLMQIAQSKGLPPTQPQLNEEQQKMLSVLQGSMGGRFDRNYVTAQVKNHQDAVAAFKQEIADGQDPDIKAFAQQNLPTIEQHLASAQALSGTHGRSMSPHHRSRHIHAVPAAGTTDGGMGMGTGTGSGDMPADPTAH